MVVATTIAESINKNKNRVVLNKQLSFCISPNCKGWITDSVTERIWIKCNDPKHNDSVNHNSGLESGTENSANSFHPQPGALVGVIQYDIWGEDK